MYLSMVDPWMTLLYQKVVPDLHRNGGPIIMVQVENEFGIIGRNSP
jgi:beta-galactosidase